MAAAPFDLAALFHDVNRGRTSRGLSWAALGREVGVSASTIRRFEVADDAEADGVLALVRWLRACPEDYVNDMVKWQRLAEGSVGIVRVDMELVTAAGGAAPSSRARSRTTIQRLVRVARNSDRSVASLTRLSEL